MAKEPMPDDLFDVYFSVVQPSVSHAPRISSSTLYIYLFHLVLDNYSVAIS